MATRLRNLKIRKVDFVDEGANPDAHIRMIKQKDGEGQSTKKDGIKEPRNILKKLLGFIGKAAGMDQEEIDSAVDEIQKGSHMSFDEKIAEANNRKIADEMWDICYALQSSLYSILNDEEMDSASAAAAMQESLDEFYAVAQESIPKWSSGKSANLVRKDGEVSETDLEIMKAAAERLSESIEKACKDAWSERSSGGDRTGNEEKTKGEGEEMKIDKSKLTDAEKAFLESIEKRYGTKGEDIPENGSHPLASAPSGQVPDGMAVIKSAAQIGTEEVSIIQSDEADGIYKGLHPAVRAEMEALKKFREDAENRELMEVAKKYAIIGKKEEELVPLFKSLKAAGGTAYDDMVAVLDQAVAMVEKSGAFSEIGKSGHFGSGGNSAEAKISGIAKGYMEKDPTLSYSAAVAKAWEDNPEILSEYDEEAGF